MRFTTVTDIEGRKVEVNMDNVTHMITRGKDTYMYFNGGITERILVTGNANDIRFSVPPEVS